MYHPDYKALVCIGLPGGCDNFNTVLATDTPSWEAYTAVRGTPVDNIALAKPGTKPTSGTLHQRLGGAIPIVPRTTQEGRTFALHPSMPNMKALFEQKRLAIVANVGTLIGPTTKADYDNFSPLRPRKLGSHNDQFATWHSGTDESAHSGWGGTALAQIGQPKHMWDATSIDGDALWLNNPHFTTYQTTPNGPIKIQTLDGNLWGSPEALTAIKSIMSSPQADYLLQEAWAAACRDSISTSDALSAILPAQQQVPWGLSADPLTDPKLKYKEPGSDSYLYNPLAHQLQMVARLIAAANDEPQTSRQIFYVSLPGWDTHDEQQSRHAALLAQLDAALAYFNTTLISMGVDGKVTTFTMSDFGRAMSSNGDGCDHGWGGHAFVMGGAVKGGDIYGRFPDYSKPDAQGKFPSPDQLDSGMLLPAQSVNQYAATLLEWFGVQSPALVLPQLANWAPEQWNLGFLAK